MKVLILFVFSFSAFAMPRLGFYPFGSRDVSRVQKEMMMKEAYASPQFFICNLLWFERILALERAELGLKTHITTADDYLEEALLKDLLKEVQGVVQSVNDICAWSIKEKKL